MSWQRFVEFVIMAVIMTGLFMLVSPYVSSWAKSIIEGGD